MTILSALIPSASSDVVAVYLSPGNIPGQDLPAFLDEVNVVQVFSGARPITIRAAEPTRYMVHPLETGANVTDHRIILPVTLSVSFIMRPEDYRETYLAMRQAKNLSLEFTVQTKTDNYTNLYISDMPHEETPEFADTVTIIVQFREVQFFDTGSQELTVENVLSPIDSSTVARGEQTPMAPTTEQNNQGSTLFRVFGGLL